MKLKIRENRLRLKGKPSLSEVSRATGVKTHTLRGLEQGTCKRVYVSIIDALCTYLECEAKDLVEVESVSLPLPGTRKARQDE